MSTNRVTAWTLASLLISNSVSADDAMPEPGSRVRLWSESVGGLGVGRLVGLQGQTATLDLEKWENGRKLDHRVTVDLASVTRFQLSQNRRRHAADGALYGLLITAAAAGLVYAGTENMGECCSAETFVGVGAAVGAVLGAGLGALYVTDEWRDVKASAVDWRGRGRRPQLSARVSFSW